MKKKKEQIITNRLILKSFKEEDSFYMVPILRNEEISKTFMLPDFKNDQEAYSLFQKLVEMCNEDNHFLYGIFYNDRPIGFLNDCDIEEDKIEIGYIIDPLFQGKGFATEAFKAAIEELFRIGYKTVIAGYFESNIASKRVMEKCGMHPIKYTDYSNYRGNKYLTLYYSIEKI